MRGTVILGACGLLACSVQLGGPDPADVPTASGVDCALDQVLIRTMNGWACAEAGEAGVTHGSFGSCSVGDRVTGFDPDTGAVLCEADRDTDVDTLMARDCAEAQLLVRSADDWACRDTVAASHEAFGTCAANERATGVDVQTDHVACSPDRDSPDLLASLACSNGQVAESTSNGWACANAEIPYAGTVTSITAGAGAMLTPDHITGAGEVTPDNSAIVDAVTSALGDRLLPEACPAGGVPARGAAGWHCASTVRCPPGFRYSPEGGFDVCVRELQGFVDEMVKVGSFWIDRYEVRACPEGASVGGATGSDTQAAACSVADEIPREQITWFQAGQMCANAGKRACTNAEWQMAASGTPDNGTGTAAEACLVTGGGPDVTGSHDDCASRFGAYDMGGNLQEIGGDWFAAAGTDELVEAAYRAWSGWGSDGIWNLSGVAYDSAWLRFPAMAFRGGHALSGSSGRDAGIFCLVTQRAPSYAGFGVLAGARCCAGTAGTSGDPYGEAKSSCSDESLLFEDFKEATPLVDLGGDHWQGATTWWFASGGAPSLEGDYLVLRSSRSADGDVREEAQADAFDLGLTDDVEVIVGAWSDRWVRYPSTEDYWTDTSVGVEAWQDSEHSGIVLTHGNLGVFHDPDGSCPDPSTCLWAPVAAWDALRVKLRPMLLRFSWAQDVETAEYAIDLRTDGGTSPLVAFQGVDFISAEDLHLRLNANVTDQNVLLEDEEQLYVDFVCVRAAP